MLSKHKLVGNRQKGFTLVEMLVVAALIAIFAGLAVFNIIEQLNREKVKAATAEARSIATSLSFAYSDMGFYPKLCFLRFSYEELQKYFTENASLTPTTMEYFDATVEGTGTKLKQNWKQKYLNGSLPEKVINMTLSDGRTLDWPKDPFGSPYVAYLTKIAPPANDPTGTPVVSWLTSAGDKANYFAGIVSYGRNRVPGGKDAYGPNETSDVDSRYALSLYTAAAGRESDPQNRDFTLLNRSLYNVGGRLDQIINDPNTYDAAKPRIRDIGSDDRYYEF